MNQATSPARLVLRWVLGLCYLAAGIIHLRSPNGFIAITPHWVPDIPLVIALTGIAEIAGALALLLVPRLRKAAGIGLALYAICVFPANINQAINDIPIGGQHLSWWYHGPRMLLQPILVWLALWVSNVIDWPFARKPDQVAKRDEGMPINAEGERMSFYVYENWTHDRARLHRSDCSFCNNGRGTQASDSGRNGQWHGPYEQRERAVQTMAKIKRADSKECGTCKP